jgi:hypothetical protein
MGLDARFVARCSALLLVLPLATVAVATAHAAESVPARPLLGGLEGDWETVIESPRRPWAFVIHFVRSGNGWTGAMTFPGFPDFPLHEVRAESTTIHFRFPPELDSIVFEGTLAGEAITGRVLEQGQPVPTRLTRSIALPAPRDRLEAWRQDLDFLTTHLGEYDRSFSPAARVDFLRAMARLNLDLPGRNDDQILAALASAVALSGNAHTRMRLDPTRAGNFTTEFPLRMAWFADGCFVVKAAPKQARALRARVVAIDGHDLSQVRREVVRLFAGNPAWADYLTPIYLTSPDLLHGLGLIRSRKEAVWTLQDAQGARFDLRVPATPIDRDAAPAESWQDLSPLTVTGRPPWAHALAADPSQLPHYLRQPGKAYWFEYLPDPGLLYFQFNRSGDDENGPTFEAFGDSLIGFGRTQGIRGVVVDLRLNSGGNLEVAKDFFTSLAGGLGPAAGTSVRDRRALYVLGRPLPRGAAQAAHARDVRGRAGRGSSRFLGGRRRDRAAQLAGRVLLLERVPSLLADRLPGVPSLLRGAEHPGAGSGPPRAALLRRLLRRARSGPRGDSGTLAEVIRAVVL